MCFKLSVRPISNYVFNVKLEGTGKETRESKEKRGVSEMAGSVGKRACSQAWEPEFISQDPHGRKSEMTPI